MVTLPGLLLLRTEKFFLRFLKKGLLMSKITQVRLFYPSEKWLGDEIQKAGHDSDIDENYHSLPIFFPKDLHFFILPGNHFL